MKAFAGPIPKPEKKKKKKLLYNGYKDKPNRKCFYCDQYSAERHEIFCGNNRQHSIEDGLQVDLCRNHHREMQDNITPWAQEENKKWREWGQKHYELKRMQEDRMTPLQARYAFKERYGKSYLPFTEVE